MRTIRTTNGIKQIDDWNDTLIPVQLRDILIDLRASLITRLLSGLEVYIQYKFDHKATAKELHEVKAKLYSLKHSGLSLDNYHHILETVLKNENSYVDTALFYNEIDATIKPYLKFQTNSSMSSTPTFNAHDLMVKIRKDIVDNILSEQGLIAYVNQRYGDSMTDRHKILYILDELREYFAKEPIDFEKALAVIREQNLNMQEFNLDYFDREMKQILDKHFK